jgi:hypothetical protein
VHFAAASSIADLPPPQPEDTQHFAFHAACLGRPVPGCFPCAGHEDAVSKHCAAVLEHEHIDTIEDAEDMEDCRQIAETRERADTSSTP